MPLYHFIARCFCFLIVCTSFNLQAMNPISALGKLSDSLRETTDGRVNLSGYINAHYMKHDGMPEFLERDPNEALIQVREASIFADLLVTDNLLFSTELETSYDLSDKNASGRDKRLKGALNYYYFDFDIAAMRDWELDGLGNLNVRFGRILVPFLQYNENKPNFKQTLMSQPFTAWQVVPSNNAAIDFEQYGWTDFGLMLNWSREFNQGILNLKVAVINGLGVEGAVLDTNEVTLSSTMMMAMSMGSDMDSSMGSSMDMDPDMSSSMDSSMDMDSDMSSSMDTSMDTMMAVHPTVRVRDGLHNARSDWDDNSDINSDLAYSAKLTFTPYALPLNIGVSLYSGAWDEDADQNLTMTGIHVDLTQPRWHVKGEIVRAEVEQTAGLNPVVAMGPSGVNISTGDYSMSASYLEGAYSVKKYGDNNSQYVKLVLRYDRVNTNDEASFTPFHRSRQTFGVEWQFVKDVRLRAEHQRHTLEDFENAPGPFVAAGGEEEITMDMLSIIANF
ncbi:MAG: hypothetical protein COB51_07930 [Moraxellaceae bacterium]|nr:MAG: hypothetical protein COB51_07930 [Moraxellaceae bacterium]